MAKRGATEQITKDTWERDEDHGGRDRSEEPAEVASQAVLAKRKILKPRSRVAGAGGAPPVASNAPSPSLFNFGQSAAPAPAGGSLFGQPQAATPSKPNTFGSPAPSTTPTTPNPFAPNASQKTLFPNLFGTPAASNAASTVQANATPQIGTSLFGSPAAKPPSSTPFGTPAQALKPSQSLFSTTPSGPVPNGSIGSSLFNTSQAGKSASSLFGAPAANAQKPEASPLKPSTTPTATPAKQNPFSLFGNGGPTPAPKSDSDAMVAEPSNQPTTPVKSLFGTPSQPAEASTKSANATPTQPSVKPPTQGSSLFAQSNAAPSSTSLFGSPKPSTTTAPALLQPPSLFNPAAKQPETKKDSVRPKIENVDPTSLEPPAGSNLTREQMPLFNWMYQIRCLNTQFLEKVQHALTEDPYSDLSTWSEFYQKQVAKFSSLKVSQQEELGNDMNVDASDVPSKASKLFESTLGSCPVPNADPQAAFMPSNAPPPAVSTTGSLFQTKPSTGPFDLSSAPGPAPPASGVSLFPSAPTKPSGLFGNQSTSAPEPTNPAPFQFGGNNQAPKSVFEANATKEPESNGSKLFVPNSFNWNSKSNSAAPSNASSPGSVLAGGSAGMKDSGAGGWANPFTQNNPLFLQDDDNEDDEDDDDNEDNGYDDDVQIDAGEEPSEETSAATTGSSGATKTESTSASSIFGAQPSSSNSLFGRVTSSQTATPQNFWQPSAPKTGAVGLFGSTTAVPAADAKTWTPEKGIIFGNPSDTKPNASAGAAQPSKSLFGNQGAGSSGSIFGNSSSTSVPSFNFSAPTNGKSIFSNPPAKPATPPVLFGGQPSGGLAPPSLFGGPSPAPSDISTPGESSNKEGGEEDGEPSDEAGSVGNTKDLSGRGPGEEDEDEVFEARSSIYNLKKGAYVKIGIGRLRVLKNRNTSRSRVVVKVETGKVLMNVGIRKELDYSRVSESEAKGKVVKILEILPGGESRVWVMKVGTVELAQKLRTTLEENK
ncbi:hypothetical protein DRE_05126 [Drechslerella stenobrocha 248]|uniref:RanBD1 domain-containing protein n=1 Tax=Drechslerella stenobrocha 248 TaxID=1043628 RepID=W7HRH5_9PEZI|nr:hypothetical protein DRE_05126 [Drechslerella stenobrocha 248]